MARLLKQLVANGAYLKAVRSYSTNEVSAVAMCRAWSLYLAVGDVAGGVCGAGQHGSSHG